MISKKNPLFICICICMLACLGCDKKKEPTSSADDFKEDLKTICWIARDNEEIRDVISIAPVDKRLEMWALGVNSHLKSAAGKALFEEIGKNPEAGRCAPLYAAIEEAGLQAMGCGLMCPFSDRYTAAALKDVRLPVVNLSPRHPESDRHIPLGDDTIAITLKGDALRLSGRPNATPQEVIAASKGKRVHLLTDISTTVGQLEQVSASLKRAGAESSLLIARIDDREQRRGASTASMPLVGDGGDVHIPFTQGEGARDGLVVQVILSSEGAVVQFSSEGRTWRLPSSCANKKLTLCASSPSEPAAGSLYNILFSVRRAMAWGDSARLELYATPSLSAHHLIGWMELMRFVLVDAEDKDQAVLIDANDERLRYMSKGDLWAPVFMGTTPPPLAEVVEALESRKVDKRDNSLKPQHHTYFSTFLAERSPRIASCYAANATVQAKWVAVLQGEQLWNVCPEYPNQSIWQCANAAQSANPMLEEMSTLAQCLREALTIGQTFGGKDVIAEREIIMLPLPGGDPLPLP